MILARALDGGMRLGERAALLLITLLHLTARRNRYRNKTQNTDTNQCVQPQPKHQPRFVYLVSSPGAGHACAGQVLLLVGRAVSCSQPQPEPAGDTLVVPPNILVIHCGIPLILLVVLVHSNRTTQVLWQNCYQ